MKNTVTILTVIAVTIIASGFIFSSSKDTGKIDQAPEFNKETFWKNRIEQLTTFTGQKASYAVNSSCYIDRATTYKGADVYQATYMVVEERKIGTFFIDKKNLKIMDAIGLFPNYADTLTVEFELLNFPLYNGKKWDCISRYQDGPRKPVISYSSTFEVFNSRDSVFNVNGQEIKTKAYFLKGELTADNKTLAGNYLYLAPVKNFPGTCPVFLWLQFFKDLSPGGKENKVLRKYTITDFNL